MDIKKEKFIAYCAVVALFVVGVVCYAAFPDKKPEEPIRAMLNAGPGAAGGKVLFTHKEHKDHNVKESFGLECIDCHHQYVKEGGKVLYLRKDDSTGEKPIACSKCHETVKAEDDDSKQPKRADAFHIRCRGCHDDAGHGPGSGSEECSGCHLIL